MPPHVRAMTEEIHILYLLTLFYQNNSKEENFYFKLLGREQYVLWLDIVKSVF